jgi:surface antigen
MPNPLADLFENVDATPVSPAPLVREAPQFSSRRELKASTTARGRALAPVAASKPAASKSRPAGISSKTRSPKLTRKERSLARKLAVAPAPKATTSSKPVKRKNPALVMFVLLVISGFIGGIALPAYAFPPSQAGAIPLNTATVDTSRLQTMKVGATIQASKVNRDAIKATTDAEYKAQQITAASLANASTAYGDSGTAYGKVGAHQAGDDYPWPAAANTLSPLGYFYRQCVDFVAWRLNRDAGVTSAPWKWTWHNLTPGGGNASEWKAAWEAHGWKTSATPVIGSVAWFNGNHVAYVKAVEGSNVVIEEYNGTSSRSYAKRTIPIDTVGRFLYPPP